MNWPVWVVGGIVGFISGSILGFLETSSWLKFLCAVVLGIAIVAGTTQVK